MFIRRFILASLVAALCSVATLADENPTLEGTAGPTASEAAFVAAMRADLGKRFATVASAEAAGYFRYTNADDSGAISYANLHWQSNDVHHPSQLWYGKDGQLLGADYSILKSGAARPRLWGIQPGRWAEFDEHVHYVAKDPKTGALTYDNYLYAKKFVGVGGGDMKHPQAATLVKLHLVSSAADVEKIFDFPTLWDLIIWVKPNPSGPFAEKNPLVKA